MIDFYAATTPNTLKVFFMLGETGLPFRLHRVRLYLGEQFSPEFMNLHPYGKVPAIVDNEGPDGTPHTVFESGAILAYLAEKTGRFLGRTAAERSTIMQWLILQMSSLGPGLGNATHFSRGAPPGNDYGRRRFVTQAVRLCEVFDRRLRESPYLGGAEFSIADIAAFPWLWRHPGMLDIDTTGYAGLARWLAEIEVRPGFRAHYDEYKALVKLDRADRDAATPDDIDRFFGRGRYFRV
jgi:GST-like protein